MATRKSKGTGFVAVDEIEFRRFEFECTFQPSKAKPTTTTQPPTTTKAPTTSPAPTTIPTTTVEPTEPFECKYRILNTYLVAIIYYLIMLFCCVYDFQRKLYFYEKLQSNATSIRTFVNLLNIQMVMVLQNKVLVGSAKRENKSLTKVLKVHKKVQMSQ